MNPSPSDKPVQGPTAFLYSAKGIADIVSMAKRGCTEDEIIKKYTGHWRKAYKNFCFVRIAVRLNIGSEKAAVTSYELVSNKDLEAVESFFKDKPLNIGAMHNDFCVLNEKMELEETIIECWEELEVVVVENSMEIAYWEDVQKDNKESYPNYGIVKKALSAKVYLEKEWVAAPPRMGEIDEDFNFTKEVKMEKLLKKKEKKEKKAEKKARKEEKKKSKESKKEKSQKKDKGKKRKTEEVQPFGNTPIKRVSSMTEEEKEKAVIEKYMEPEVTNHESEEEFEPKQEDTENNIESEEVTEPEKTAEEKLNEFLANDAEANEDDPMDEADRLIEMEDEIANEQ